jgi:alkylhydroperoxidase/carboxymuconolactone decarboxylase family protein YurZ
VTELSERQQQVKERFIEVRGETAWNSSFEAMLVLDADFLDSYTDFSGVPFGKNRLEDKVKEFIYIAVDSAATHMFAPGVRQHVRRAIELGATEAEVMEVLELTATLGIHACNIGVPLLVEVLKERGEADLPSIEGDPLRSRLKAEFEAKRGYWHQFWDEFLQVDPELFEAYLGFSGHPWENGVLEPKVKEFVYTAFDASATHLYIPGLKLHMRNALGLGATVGEIIEVLEIASVVGIHACSMAAPIVLEEFQRAAVTD